jgi:hypothetical protein
MGARKTPLSVSYIWNEFRSFFVLLDLMKFYASVARTRKGYSNLRPLAVIENEVLQGYILL